jgi:Holliday junction resolvasome RuvABC endonuclease subunit
MPDHRSQKGLLFALDPSLTRSGWSVFSLTNSRLLLSGVLSPPGPDTNFSRRLDILHADVKRLFLQLELGKNDIFVCEGPAPLVRNPLSALKVERVRGIFEALARECGVCVPGRLNPRTVQTEILGMRGTQPPRATVKAAAKEVCSRLYGETLQSSFDRAVELKLSEGARSMPQDIVDAALIGSLALSRVLHCRQTGQDIYEVFAASGSGRTRKRWGGSRRSSGWTEKDFRTLRKGVG